MLRLHPEEGQKRKCQQGQSDENNAPDSETGEDRPVRTARRSIHDVQLMRLERDYETKRDRSHHIDPENLRRRDRHGEADENGYRNNQGLGDVGRQHKQDRFFDVVVDRAAFLYCGRDRGEVVVREDHLRGLLGHLGAFDAHGDAYVSLFQSWRVVYTVTRHCHDLLVRLDGFHQAELMFRACTSEYVDVAYFLLQRCGAHLFDLGPGERGLAVANPEHLGNCRGGDLMIARYHRDANAAAVAFLDRFNSLLAGWVQQSDQANQDQCLG